MSMISLEGLDKFEVLAALYNASRPQGMGFLHYDPKPMTPEDARLIGVDHYIDYLKGRVMKIDLRGDTFDSWLYDRDNGQGAAERVVSELRKSKDVNTPAIQETHKSGVVTAAALVREQVEESTSYSDNDGVLSVNMGLSDVKDELVPKVDEALSHGD